MAVLFPAPHESPCGYTRSVMVVVEVILNEKSRDLITLTGFGFYFCFPRTLSWAGLFCPFRASIPRHFDTFDVSLPAWIALT